MKFVHLSVRTKCVSKIYGISRELNILNKIKTKPIIALENKREFFSVPIGIIISHVRLSV